MTGLRLASAPTGVARVVLADNHPVIRTGMRMLVEADHRLRVVAEAGDVAGAIAHVRTHRPDVLLLDLTLPGGSSLDAIPAIRSASPRTAIVVLTMHDEPAFARAALRAGAYAYVLKERAAVELVDAIRTAMRGGTYVTPCLRR
jgi:two-component system response regulator NreC